MTMRWRGRRSPSSRTRATDCRPGVAGRVAGALHVTRLGAQGTTSALQTLPDSTLMGVAAGSLGMGAGFYLARAPRLAIVAGIVPALVMGVAILLRPLRSRPRTHTEGDT
jgi:hypothetical protein